MKAKLNKFCSFTEKDERMIQGDKGRYLLHLFRYQSIQVGT